MPDTQGNALDNIQESAPAATPALNACPPATQDIAINLTNRKKAIDTAMYGPLNPAEPNDEYWKALGKEWNVDEETAKKQRCGNCAVFIQTPEMKACIEGGLTDNVDEFEAIDAKGDLGYCEIFDFKCASARTCRAWVAGGPVTAAAEEAIDLISEVEPITAAQGPCWDGYKQVGMKKGKNGDMVPNCVPKDASDDSEFATKKRTVSQTPAPKKDKVKGSDKNKKGSASGSRKVVFSKATENTLSTKVKEHNEKAPASRKASLGMLKAVYRRGAGAFSTSHRPGMNRNQWAMGRVNAFLKLLKSGKPTNSAYTTDNDLLPSGHPRSSKAVRASAEKINYEEELSVSLGNKEDYIYPEDAILAMAEFSGLGYEAEEAIRASWLRAVRAGGEPFTRASMLAIHGEFSIDADLLPRSEEGNN